MARTRAVRILVGSLVWLVTAATVALSVDRLVQPRIGGDAAFLSVLAGAVVGWYAARWATRTIGGIAWDRPP